MLILCNWRRLLAHSVALTTTIFFLTIPAANAQNLDIFTIAGNGAAGLSGDGGPAVDARLFGPTSVVKDAAGNLYIADAQNHVIRKVDVGGIITTIAGTGVAGYSGDGQMATAAKLNEPFGIDLDAAGNLLIADLKNHVIRRVDLTTGIIDTIVGDGETGPSLGDGGDPLQARLYQPIDISVDNSGAIFIADRLNHRIRKVEADLSSISTVAGSSSTAGFSGDGGPAVNAELARPQGVFVDAMGNIFIADTDNHAVRRVEAATGVIDSIAGDGNQGGSFAGDGGLATDARLRGPRAVHVDGSGVIYVADTFNQRVRTFTLGGNIETFAGSGPVGENDGEFNGEGAAATDSIFNFVEDVYVDVSGIVIIADEENHRIRHAVPETLNAAPSSLEFHVNDLPIDVKSSDGLGARVGQLISVDADLGDTHAYTLVRGKGDDDNGRFGIVGTNDNILRVGNPITNTGVLLVRVQTFDGVDATLERAFVITVVDDLVPTITLLGDNPLNLNINDPYVEPGATASDEGDGDITGAIIIDASAVVTSQAGDYDVTYNVMDAAGNAAVMVTRTVSVAAGESDLSATGSGPASVETGNAATYTVTITNNGPDDAPSVMVSIDVPTVVTVNTVTPGQGMCTVGANITCDLGTLANAGIVNITIDVTASATAGNGTATISVSSASVDNNAANDTGSVDVTVTAPPPPPPKKKGGGSTGLIFLGLLALMAAQRRRYAR